MKEYRPFLLALLVLALLTPLGLHLPRIVKTAGAWGEWSLAEVEKMVGYEPAGMKERAGAWGAPLRSYALPGDEKGAPGRPTLSYLLSAVVGIAACGGGAYLLARGLASRKNRETDHRP